MNTSYELLTKTISNLGRDIETLREYAYLLKSNGNPIGNKLEQIILSIESSVDMCENGRNATLTQHLHDAERLSQCNMDWMNLTQTNQIKNDNIT